MIGFSKTLLLYLIVFVSLILSHKFSPTTLAGPGLDFFVYALSFVLVLTLLSISIYKSVKQNKFDWLVALHVVALSFIILLSLTPS